MRRDHESSLSFFRAILNERGTYHRLNGVLDGKGIAALTRSSYNEAIENASLKSENRACRVYR